MAVVNEVESLEELAALGGSLRGIVVQGVDLRSAEIAWDDVDLRGAVFLGCVFPDAETELATQRRGGIVFPRFTGVPYNPYRGALYSREELTAGAGTPDGSLDERIRRHVEAHGGRNPDIMEALAQRIHDHAIDNAAQNLLLGPDGAEAKRVVGIMGSHGTARTDPGYALVAHLAWLLARRGYFVVSGGGPGTMEAANLGAWLAARPEQAVVDQALAILARAPDYQPDPPRYVDAASEVLARWPGGGASLGIPTWLYADEPTSQFATSIAKYFANSIREDGLLAVAAFGVVFAPGGPGTAEEIVIDLAKNSYRWFGGRSPMVFCGREHYLREPSLYRLAEAQAHRDGYGDLVLCSDDPVAMADFIDGKAPEVVETAAERRLGRTRVRYRPRLPPAGRP